MNSLVSESRLPVRLWPDAELCGILLRGGDGRDDTLLESHLIRARVGLLVGQADASRWVSMQLAASQISPRNLSASAMEEVATLLYPLWRQAWDTGQHVMIDYDDEITRACVWRVFRRFLDDLRLQESQTVGYLDDRCMQAAARLAATIFFFSPAIQGEQVVSLVMDLRLLWPLLVDVREVEQSGVEQSGVEQSGVDPSVRREADVVCLLLTLSLLGGKVSVDRPGLVDGESAWRWKGRRAGLAPEVMALMLKFPRAMSWAVRQSMYAGRLCRACLQDGVWRQAHAQVLNGVERLWLAVECFPAQHGVSWGLGASMAAWDGSVVALLIEGIAHPIADALRAYRPQAPALVVERAASVWGPRVLTAHCDPSMLANREGMLRWAYLLVVAASSSVSDSVSRLPVSYLPDDTLLPHILRLQRQNDLVGTVAYDELLLSRAATALAGGSRLRSHAFLALIVAGSWGGDVRPASLRMMSSPVWWSICEVCFSRGERMPLELMCVADSQASTSNVSASFEAFLIAQARAQGVARAHYQRVLRTVLPPVQSTQSIRQAHKPGEVGSGFGQASKVPPMNSLLRVWDRFRKTVVQLRR